MNIEARLKQVEEMVEKAKIEGGGRYILTATAFGLELLKSEHYKPGMPLIWMFNHNSFTWGLTPENWNCLADRIAKQVKKGVLK